MLAGGGGPVNVRVEVRVGGLSGGRNASWFIGSDRTWKGSDSEEERFCT